MCVRQELLDNQSKVGGAPNISFSRALPMELQGEGAPPVAITNHFAGFISFGALKLSGILGVCVVPYCCTALGIPVLHHLMFAALCCVRCVIRCVVRVCACACRGYVVFACCACVWCVLFGVVRVLIDVCCVAGVVLCCGCGCGCGCGV